MGTRDGRFYVVYNGEIYNYLELREELQSLGYSFNSRSDTEVLLAAYAQWGKQALRRFVGMFAFALLDTQQRTVLLARDFFGIKPLYYWEQEDFLCFGSEIKALFGFGLCRPQANAERLLFYLRYGMTDFGSQTLLSRVQQLPAAHYLELSVDGGDANVPQSYWSLESTDEGELDISFDEAAQRVRDLFLRSVALHLRSDVPLGSALSGGIDSSSIVMAIRHLHSNAEIHAFSFIAEDHALSEERWIDIVAREAGAHIHRVRATATDLVAELETMLHFHDEPFGSTSACAQYQVFRAARAAGIKVMLDGQGADEILGGYRCYLGARLASLLRQNRWSEAAHLMQGFSRLDGFGRFRGLAHCADYLLPPSLQSAVRKFMGKEMLPAWLNQRWFVDRGISPSFINYTKETNVLRNSLSRSVRETLPGLLRYEDRNSMAASVESRVPFLTPDLVTFLRRLPEEYIVARDGTSKAVFRAAMRGIVPDAILDRRDKLGFVTPERRWLHLLDSWVRSVLGSDTAHRMPFLNVGVARQEWESITKGRGRFDFRVWRWLNLIRWTEKLEVVFS